jgi:hypothetical protein
MQKIHTLCKIICKLITTELHGQSEWRNRAKDLPTFGTVQINIFLCGLITNVFL